MASMPRRKSSLAMTLQADPNDAGPSLPVLSTSSSGCHPSHAVSETPIDMAEQKQSAQSEARISNCDSSVMATLWPTADAPPNVSEPSKKPKTIGAASGRDHLPRHGNGENSNAIAIRSLHTLDPRPYLAAHRHRTQRPTGPLPTTGAFGRSQRPRHRPYYAEPDGSWRCVCRSVDSNEPKDSIMGWFKTGKESKEFAEAQTQGQYYVVKRKRTKAEILRRARVRQ